MPSLYGRQSGQEDSLDRKPLDRRPCGLEVLSGLEAASGQKAPSGHEVLWIRDPLNWEALWIGDPL